MTARCLSRIMLLGCVVFLSIMMLGQLSFAAEPAGEQPGAHLKITEVFVDFDNQEIIITGEDFDFGPGPLEVSLGEFGTITDRCVPSFSLPHMIVCDFSVGGLPADGDYLLTVATGAGQSQSDEYDLTIGAVGPQGPRGGQGPEGDDGDQGIQGPPGSPCQAEKTCWRDGGKTHVVTMTCSEDNTVAWPAGKCGDGFLDVDCEEACDDGNYTGEDGCTSVCTVEEGWTCDPDSGCECLGTCEGDGEYCQTDEDCAALPGTCPRSGSYGGESCWVPSDCLLGRCSTSSYVTCTWNNHCLFINGVCVRTCPLPSNNCIPPSSCP
jgi:cysteine-rich repeat protein